MKYSIPFLLFVLLAGSCEKSITINLPEQQPKLVVNAVIVRGGEIRVRLTHTLSNAESGIGRDASVSDALLVLYRDGQYADTLDEAGAGDYLSDIVAAPGHHYRLSVTHPSYPPVEAETDAPADVPVTGWSVTPNVRRSSDGGDQDLLRVHIQDPATAGDHYILQILGAGEYQPDTYDFYSWGDCVNTADPGFESPYGSDFPGEDACFPARALLLRDALFNGQEKELRMYASSYTLSPRWEWQGTDTTYAAVRVAHVTPQFYQFVKSYRGSRDAGSNPFAEPYNISSNVKGGYGIFTILSEQSFEVRR